ASM
ncbi:AAA domain protein, partial [Vibrio parahaemolyticus V-223/04]